MKETGLPLSLTLCLLLFYSERCSCLKFGLSGDLNDLRWKWRIKHVDWRYRGGRTDGFLTVWSLSAPSVAKRVLTQTLNLEHPVCKNCTKHSARMNLVPYRRHTGNFFPFINGITSSITWGIRHAFIRPQHGVMRYPQSGSWKCSSVSFSSQTQPGRNVKPTTEPENSFCTLTHGHLQDTHQRSAEFLWFRSIQPISPLWWKKKTIEVLATKLWWGAHVKKKDYKREHEEHSH